MTQGILLAAGQSSRYGSLKLLAPLDDGRPMIMHSIDNMSKALEKVLVVVNNKHRELIGLLQTHDIHFFISPRSLLGMGNSIADAVQYTRSATGWIIAPGDMPYIKPETFSIVQTCLQQGRKICAPCFNNRRGHPVGFDRQYAEQLMQLDGDRGARTIITQNKTDTTLLEVKDDGVLQDIDYPDDIKC
jgi:molybdenum cofactor cytidylyltransferase